MLSFQDFKDKLLIAIVGIGFTMLYSSMQEMRTDIKKLLEQTASHSARLDNLERMAFKPTAYKVPFPPSDVPRLPYRHEMVAVLRDENLTPENNETFNRRTKRKLLEYI